MEKLKSKLNYYKEVGCTLNSDEVKKILDELEKKDKMIEKFAYIVWNYDICECEITDFNDRKCEYIPDDAERPCIECIKKYVERQVQ